MVLSVINYVAASLKWRAYVLNDPNTICLIRLSSLSGFFFFAWKYTIGFVIHEKQCKAELSTRPLPSLNKIMSIFNGVIINIYSH